VAAGLEAVSNTWNFNAYALVPVGTKEYRLNSNYNGGALDTYGLDVGYAITPDFKASVGYYYQNGDLKTADGSGVNGRLAYNISNGLTAGVNLSYDQAFETRFSADLIYRFGGNGNKTASEKKAWQTPVIQSLTEAVRHRDVRVHDSKGPNNAGCIPAIKGGPMGSGKCTYSDGQKVCTGRLVQYPGKHRQFYTVTDCWNAGQTFRGPIIGGHNNRGNAK
jgi:hypothetical protein